MMDPDGGSSCGYCNQGVEPTCAMWREANPLRSPRIEAYPTRGGSPVGRMDVEPPRMDRNLQNLLADLGEQCSKSPLEPQVKAALETRLCEGIPDSPFEPLIPKAANLEVMESPRSASSAGASGPTSTIRTRLQHLQQEAGLASTGNLIIDVRQLGAQFDIPFTTLNEVIAGCEAALGIGGGTQPRSTPMSSPRGDALPLPPVQRGRTVDSSRLVIGRGGRR